MRRFDVVIVGGGHGGAQAAIALRQRKYNGSIAIVGEEPHPPYERPPLSKDYLAGEKTFERIMIRPQAFWLERDIELLLGRRVVHVDPGAKRVQTEGGEAFGYGALIWAAGGVPRRLTCDGGALAGVHTVRTKADVDQIVSELPKVHTVCVIGGGYIGLEAASALSKLGRKVILLEAQDRLLARVSGAALSNFLEAEHRRHGVEVRLATTVTSLEGTNGHIEAVHLANGERLPCDLVVVGIGIIPSVLPVGEAGAQVEYGVVVDQYCRTGLPGVLAIGDCALHGNSFVDGALIRLESVQNAHDMASTAASVITGEPVPYRAVPWFWSNQYALRLQTVGLTLGYDTELIRGDPESGSFSIVYLKRGVVVAFDCVNAPKDYVQGRSLIGRRPSLEALKDSTVPLKDLVGQ